MTAPKGAGSVRVNGMGNSMKIGSALGSATGVGSGAARLQSALNNIPTEGIAMRDGTDHDDREDSHHLDLGKEPRREQRGRQLRQGW